MLSIGAVVAAAGVDPYALQQQLVAGRPDAIFVLARAFDDAGAEAGHAYRAAGRAHRLVGQGFTNDGAAVLDVAAHDRRSWQLLGQGGDDMHATAAQLKRVGTVLEENAAAGAAALRRMEQELAALQAQWNRWAAQQVGPIDPGAQQQLLASAVQIVQAGARAIQAQIDDYESALGSASGAMQQLGYAPTGPDAPGQPGGARYVIGPPTRPPFTFDDDFVRDPDADPGFGDYVDWNEWGLRARGARVLRPDLDDALDLYGHYRDGTGTPATVDYEEAYREDPHIREGVEVELGAVRTGVEEIYRQTGQTSFSFTGDATSSGDYPQTENWQKALGGHQIWSSGDVRVEGNTVTATVTVHAEDRYNFNKGEADIATGTPDEVNGRFAELGWARSFDVSGTVTRTVTWEIGGTAPPVVSEGDTQRDPAGEDRVDGAGSGR